MVNDSRMAPWRLLALVVASATAWPSPRTPRPPGSYPAAFAPPWTAIPGRFCPNVACLQAGGRDPPARLLLPRGLPAASMSGVADSARRRKRALFRERPATRGLGNSSAAAEFGPSLVVNATEAHTATVIWLSGSTTRFDTPKVRPPAPVCWRPPPPSLVHFPPHLATSQDEEKDRDETG